MIHVNDDMAEISIDLSIHRGRRSHDSHRSLKRRVTEQQKEEARPLSEERTLPVPEPQRSSDQKRECT